MVGRLGVGSVGLGESMTFTCCELGWWSRPKVEGWWGRVYESLGDFMISGLLGTFFHRARHLTLQYRSESLQRDDD